MRKPNGTPQGPQNHHFCLHHGARWLAERCGSDTEAITSELQTLPGKARCKEIHAALRAELFAHSDLHVGYYNAIWHQLQSAADSLGVP